MQITHCVITVKQSIFDRGGRAAELAKKGDATALRLIKADAEQQRTIEVVRKTLAKHKIGFAEFSAREFSAKEKKQINAADLVISIGGDGTALGSSHYITRGLMLGVNSAPGDSVGHFCHSHRKNFAAKFQAILRGHWQPTKLVRLEISLDEKQIPELALNDVLVAHDCPAATTRYILQIGEQQEEQRSSGIWIATAAGSTAGIKSAGGKVMPRSSQKMQYLVRELYREPNREYLLVRGFVPPPEEIVVASKMQQSHIYVDGARTTYPFSFGTRVKIRTAEFPLQLFLA